MDRSVELHIGPVASDLASEWIANARRVISALKAYRGALSIAVDDEMLDLCDSVLLTWETVASRGEVFEWSAAMSESVVQGVIEQWLQIGAMTDDELVLLGVTWAPERTRPMADAVTRGVIDVLPVFDQATKRRFAELLEPRAE